MSRLRTIKNQPTPLVQAGGHAEPAASLATDTQPQFTTSIPRASTDAAAARKTTSRSAITSAASRRQTPSTSSSPATSSTQGRVTAARFDGGGPATCHWYTILAKPAGLSILSRLA